MIVDHLRRRLPQIALWYGRYVALPIFALLAIALISDAIYRAL